MVYPCGVGEDRTHAHSVGRDRDRLTIAEAATLLGVHKNTVRNRIKNGTYQAETVQTERGPTYLIERESLLTNLTTNTLSSASQELVSRSVMEFVQELLRPFVSELGQVREELGAERARRQIVEERAAVLEAELEAFRETRETPETATVDEEGAKTLEVRAPSPPQLTPILGTLSAAVVGSIPWLQDVLEVNLNLSPPVTSVPLALFVLPFIFGLYRGVWNRRIQEFQEHAPRPTPAQHDGEAIGEEAVEPLRWGTREVIVALLTAAGAALVAFVETLLRIVVIQAEWVPRNVFAIIWVFIFTFLFYIFASLIGAATGGQRSGSPSSSVWWNPQLILSLLGTIITAIATVYAATHGG
jgi:excisionase family DNA binding protein